MSGGPAFPVPAVYDPTRERIDSSAAYTGESGMTMRDYFAAAALQGMLARHGSRPFDPFGKTPEGYAGAAYAVADAMLKERAP